ncbi:uncharacterized protein TNCV_791651 [Trichonephila clavipes]|nr:uncharacterized protein TNCV_791651 [Trichonephila clavipes]
MIAITAEIESGFVAKDELIPLQSSFLMRSTTPNAGVDGWASRAAHVMGAAIPNVLQPGSFAWFEKTQGLLVKVLPMPQCFSNFHYWRPTFQSYNNNVLNARIMLFERR